MSTSRASLAFQIVTDNRQLARLLRAVITASQTRQTQLLL